MYISIVVIRNMTQRQNMSAVLQFLGTTEPGVCSVATNNSDSRYQAFQLNPIYIILTQKGFKFSHKISYEQKPRNKLIALFRSHTSLQRRIPKLTIVYRSSYYQFHIQESCWIVLKIRVWCKKAAYYTRKDGRMY